MNDITIVTAFYNIKRENWSGFERSDDKYFEYFEHWARMKNRIIVYVENDVHKRRVEQIREKFGLTDMTTVIVTGKCEEIDPELYDEIKTATENELQKGFHVHEKSPEAWSALYNYIMILKGWFLQDAIKRNLVTDDTAAWLDFGFGHGIDTYPLAEEFDFCWRYDFVSDKITMFYLKELDERPVFDIICTGAVYFLGFMIVGRKQYWPEFWNLMRRSMLELNATGLVDDDQTIMYMAYRKRPELFHIERTGFFTTLKEHGGGHLTLVPQKTEAEKYPWLRRVVREFKEGRRYVKYFRRQYRNMLSSYKKWYRG